MDGASYKRQAGARTMAASSHCGEGIDDVIKSRSAPVIALCSMLGAALLAACTPTVKVEAPREPITINLNIKLDADVRVKLEDQAREDISANPDIF